MNDGETTTVREGRLASILTKWTQGSPLSFFKSIPTQDLIDSGIPRDDLESNGLLFAKDKSGEFSYPKTVRSQSAIAELIRRRFSIGCVQQDIHKWMRLQGVKGNVPFPPPREGNHFNVGDSFAWVEQYIIPNRKAGEDSFGVSQALKTRIEEKRLELLEMEVAAEKRRLIPRQVAQQTGMAVISRLQNVTVTEDEREMPAFILEAMLEAGVDAARAAAIHSKYVEKTKQITDRRIARFKEAMDGFYKENDEGELAAKGAGL